MTSNSFRRFVLFLIAITVGACAFAQPAASPKAFRFRTLSWSDPVNDLFYDFNGKPMPVKAVSYARSPFYQADATDKVVFYRQIKGPDGRKVRQVVAEAAVDGKSSMLLMLFIKEPKGAIRVSVSDDETSQFPAGSYRFVNVSSHHLMIAAGSARASIAPGESKVLTSEVDKATHGVNIRLATAAGEASKMVYADVWLWSADARTLVYASDTGNAQAPVDLKRLTENARFDKT